MFKFSKTIVAAAGVSLFSIGIASADPYTFMLNGTVNSATQMDSSGQLVGTSLVPLSAKWQVDDGGFPYGPGNGYFGTFTITGISIDGVDYTAYHPGGGLQITNSFGYLQYKGYSNFSLDGDSFTSFDGSTPFTNQPVTFRGTQSIQVQSSTAWIPIRYYFTSDSPLTLSYAPLVAAAVPEIGTWAMMMIGIGAIGVAMRRRSRTVISPALC